MRGTYPFEDLFEQIAFYYKAGRRNGLIILEIGVRGGCSTKRFLIGLEKRNKSGRKGKLYSIDIKECHRTVSKMSKDYWEFICSDSKLVKWDKEIDVLYIDGDHSYEGCKADYDKYEPYVRKGGLILIHDTTLCMNEVGKFFWEEINYPRANLNIARSGLGIVNKI